MTTTATTPGSTTNTNGSTDGKSPRAAVTPIEAAGKISKILDQLSPADRKRVLAFVSEGVE